MADIEIGLAPRRFAEVFPFHIALDRDMRVVRTGDALRRLCPDVEVGDPFGTHFRVRRPFGGIAFDRIPELERALVVVESTTNEAALRGQMILDESGERAVFLCSPLITDLAKVASLGITLGDLAVHDATADYLILLQSRTTALADVRRLAALLESQRAELRRARDLAVESARLKSEFLATMSHEIRTPMNAVIGMAALLLASDLADGPREFAEIIRASADHLLEIIDDILDFSKIEAGKVELARVAFDPRAVVAEAVDLAGERAREKRLDLARYVEASVPGALLGDPGRLRQVLANLLTNAVKFTERGGVLVHVETGAEEDGERTLRFEVRDTGVGIDPSASERLFEAFSQADSSIARRYGGTGLGLAICKRLVGLMGGEIGVESEPGAGSRFWFTARFGEAAAREADALRAPDGATSAAADRPTLRILVADDNAYNRRVATLVLDRLGYRADAAEDGNAVLEALARRPYDLVFMDMSMPDLDGLEATRRIRAVVPADRQPRIVAMTANVLASAREECLLAGMDDYLSKPVRVDALRAVLEKCGRLSAADAPADALDDVPVLDGATIAELRELASESGDFYAELVGMFLSDAPKHIASIGAALDRRDLESLEAAAHSLKGMCRNQGAARMADVCVAVERSARAHDVAAALDALDRLRAEFERARDALTG